MRFFLKTHAKSGLLSQSWIPDTPDFPIFRKFLIFLKLLIFLIFLMTQNLKNIRNIGNIRNMTNIMNIEIIGNIWNFSQYYMKWKCLWSIWWMVQNALVLFLGRARCQAFFLLRICISVYKGPMSGFFLGSYLLAPLPHIWK